MAGYSGTPLPQKLGIKANHRVALVDSPKHFTDTLGVLPEGVNIRTDAAGKSSFDVILFFITSKSELMKRMVHLAGRLTPAGGLWICWPKKASGLATDLAESVVRAAGLETGLVDNKVCAVDDTWSGLRFVIRLVDRPKGNRPGG